MPILPNGLDVYSLFGGILAILSALFTIFSGIAQLFGSSIDSGKISMLTSTIERQDHPKRKEALEAARTRIEGRVLAKELVPWRRSAYIGFMLIAVGLYVAYPPPTNSAEGKEIEYAIVGLLMGIWAVGCAFQTLQDRLCVVQLYLSGWNPYGKREEGDLQYFFFQPGGFLISCGISTLSVLYLVSIDRVFRQSISSFDLAGFLIFTGIAYVCFITLMVWSGVRFSKGYVEQIVKKFEAEETKLSRRKSRKKK